MARAIEVPSPSCRVPVDTYIAARDWLLANDPDGPRMLEWSNTVSVPATPEHLAFEVIWIILCAGRRAQAARTIERRVLDAIRNGRPVIEVFGHRGRAAAIEEAWRARDANHARLLEIMAGGDAEALLGWCGSLSWVGNDTSFQLAKNCGVDVCKPDIWLCRLAGIPDVPRLPLRVRFPACLALCRHLSEGSGDRVAAVDSMLWLACNKGILAVGPDAGPVRLDPGRWRGGSMLG